MRMILVFAVFASLGLSGCKTVEVALDCHKICTTFNACYRTTADSAVCESRCSAHAVQDQSYRKNEDTCNACNEDRACISSSFNCEGACGPIKPRPTL